MNYAEGHSDIPARVVFQKGDNLELRSGNYTVLKQIGDGGFGAVYKIQDQYKNVIALKLLKLWENLPDSYEELCHRFSLEYKIGKVDSNHIVKNYDMGYIGGNPYINMEYCDGGSLPDNLGKFQSERQNEIFCQSVLSGLAELHKNNFIHRDIKPENILFNDKGEIKLTDFGISAHLSQRLTQKNFIGRVKQVWVTAVYSPPEQFNQGKYFNYTKPTMDIYAFGVTLYYLLSKGEVPFGDIEIYKESPSQYIKNKKNEQYKTIEHFNPSIQYRWKSFIEKCLKADADERFQTVHEAADFLGLDISQSIDSTAEWNQGACLELIYGDTSGKIFDLEDFVENKNKRLITLGRSNDQGVNNDIALEEKFSSYISKRHATLEYNGSDWFVRDGQFSTTDNKWSYSVNGLLINNFQLDKYRIAKLNSGDVIRLGEFILKYKNQAG